MATGASSEDGLEWGVVVNYNADAGYGFLSSKAADPQKDSNLYFHITSCDIQTPVPSEGEQVRFSLRGGTGQPQVGAIQRPAITSKAKTETSVIGNASDLRPKGTSVRREEPTTAVLIDTIAAIKTLQHNKELLADLPPFYQGGARPRYVYVDLDNIWVSFVRAQHMVDRFPGAKTTRDLLLNLEGFTRRVGEGEEGSTVTRMVAFYFNTPEPIAARLRALSYAGVEWDVRKQETTSDTSMQLELLIAKRPCQSHPKTLVLVTGDGNIAPNGMCFREIMDLYMRDGWCVEVHAWLYTMAKSYIEFQREYPSVVVIRPLDDGDIDEILQSRRPVVARAPQESVSVPAPAAGPESVSVPASASASAPHSVMQPNSPNAEDDHLKDAFSALGAALMGATRFPMKAVPVAVPDSKRVVQLMAVAVSEPALVSLPTPVPAPMIAPVPVSNPFPALVSVPTPAPVPGPAAAIATAPQDTGKGTKGPVAGVVQHFNAVGGYGFIRSCKSSTSATTSSNVYFHISKADVRDPLPTQGERVLFVLGKPGPKGPVAASVTRSCAAPRKASSAVGPAESTKSDHPVQTQLIRGVVTAYTVLGGFGAIVKLDGTASPDLYFHIGACDITRPPLVVGERVLLTETIGPKGPTAATVQRDSIPSTAAAASRKGVPKVAATGTTQAVNEGSIRVKLTHLQRSITAAFTGVSMGKFRMVASEAVSAINVASSAMLARSKPLETAAIQSADEETQRALLLAALKEEMNNAQRVQQFDTDPLDEETKSDPFVPDEQANRATAFFDLGYMPPPLGQRSPVRRRHHQPEPEPPRTMRCGICLDDDPVEDMFFVSACAHAYCRDSMRSYILGRINEQDVTPTCPHEGCTVTLSDVDVTQVLTAEEQEQYYGTCLNLAVSAVPDMFQCLEENCRGVGTLSPLNPRFVCPLCHSERCVQCNTRAWHEGMTCEFYRAHYGGLDS